MDRQTIEQKVKGLDSIVTGFEDYVTIRIDLTNNGVDRAVKDFYDRTDYQIARVESKLTRLTTLLTFSAEYHLVKAYFYASPGLISIISTIITIATWVYKIVKFLVNTQIARILITVHKITYIVWRDYQIAINNLLKNISDASKAIDWEQMAWDT